MKKSGFTFAALAFFAAAIVLTSDFANAQGMGPRMPGQRKPSKPSFYPPTSTRMANSACRSAMQFGRTEKLPKKIANTGMPTATGPSPRMSTSNRQGRL
ncbi:MAG: hypothetical protein MZU91_09445 [Desulfosudis oleivorans]|nr:hypothetical protein [Desulfosudis oleivorans]